MELLLKQLRNAKKLNAGKIWLKVFKQADVQRYIIDVLLQDNQLKKHVTGLNAPITDKITGSQVYSFYTEVITNGRKKAGERYNLFDTGEFYNSMKVILGANYFEIEADPIKENDNLYAKFGEEIVWLNEDSKSKLAQFLIPKYIEQTRLLLQKY